MNIFSRLIKRVTGFFRPKESKQAKEQLKKATRAIEKEPEIKIESIPKTEPIKVSQVDNRIDSIKEQLQKEVISVANERWKALENRSLESSAIQRALDDNEQTPYFDISQLTNYNDIISEATRARVFLNDITSTIEGAEQYTMEQNALKHEGKFGNQYNNWVYQYKKYDVYNIEEDYAKVAFRVYRDLESTVENYIARFGSGESIQLIYELVAQNDYRDKDNSEETDDIRDKVRTFFEQKYGGKGRKFEQEFDEENRYRNFILENIKYKNKDLETFGTFNAF